MTGLHLFKKASSLFLFGAMTAIAAPSQTFTPLLSFDGADGSFPSTALTQGADGNLYGTTTNGGSSSACDNGCGTIFKMTPNGDLTMLYSFDGLDGGRPNALVQATNGDFYGTTQAYGPNGYGTVFKITPDGTLTTLHDFCSQTNCQDGALPFAPLIQATDGNFYGSATAGGNQTGAGILFKISPSGTFSPFHNFDGKDGGYPCGNLVQATDGNFYGTTQGGGDDDEGTIFKITPNGTLTSLFTFGDPNLNAGLSPCGGDLTGDGGLVQGNDGNFYGTAYTGGPDSGGTVFKSTPTGVITVLYSFAQIDGTYPTAGLVQGTDGNFYGTTSQGGDHNGHIGNGTLFRITPDGTLTMLYIFLAQAEGTTPYAALVQDTNGKFYGPAAIGGPSNDGCSSNGYFYGCGTVFGLSVGLGPFVETRPPSGKVGAAVIILGNNLTGSTAVSFNGTAAHFSVVSNTEITANVPTGATTGEVEVITPAGTLKSNLVFRVP
jgi:uncharacterized repeat protein (TIGR03803 family)